MKVTFDIFFVFFLDGKLLSLDEVWQAIPEYYQTRLQHQRWTFITQQVCWPLHKVKPGKRITVGMETSPATIFLAISASTAARDILNERNYVCKILPLHFASGSLLWLHKMAVGLYFTRPLARTIGGTTVKFLWVTDMDRKISIQKHKKMQSKHRYTPEIPDFLHRLM